MTILRINQTPYKGNGQVQRVNVEESTRHKWVNPIINRKEGNDLELIQFPNTFRPKTQKGKKDALKAKAPQSKHYKQKAKSTVFFFFPKENGQTAIKN